MVSSHGGLGDDDRLESAFQGGVFFDVLAVFVQRRRADGAQLAAGEGGLEQIAGVHRAFGLAGADDGVQLVDEENDLPVAAGDFLDDGFEAVLEFAAIFAPAIRAPMSRAMMRLFCRTLGTSPLSMRMARPSTMAVLPTPGSPIRTGLFLVRRERTCMVRRISSSRPMTGSIFPCRAISTRSRP